MVKKDIQVVLEPVEDFRTEVDSLVNAVVLYNARYVNDSVLAAS